MGLHPDLWQWVVEGLSGDSPAFSKETPEVGPATCRRLKQHREPVVIGLATPQGETPMERWVAILRALPHQNPITHPARLPAIAPREHVRAGGG